MRLYLMPHLTLLSAFCHFMVLSCGSEAEPNGGDHNPDTLDAQQPNLDAGHQGGPDAYIAPTSDCDNLPALPRPFTVIEDTVCSEDFTFDNDGYLIAIDVIEGNIYQIEKNKTPKVLHLKVAHSGRGTRVLPNNDIAWAEMPSDIIRRIDPSGNVTTLSSSASRPDGMVLGPNGHLYVSALSAAVYDVDPETETTTKIASLPEPVEGITFGRDYNKLFVNAVVSGTIYELPVLEDGALGDFAVFARGVSDLPPGGMAVDECGNIYTTTSTGPLIRVAPDGTAETVTDYGGQKGVTQNVNFGSGQFGWGKDKIYVVMAGVTCTLYEIDVGIGPKHGPQ